MIGRTISSYRIAQKIGAGGIGEVYRGVDLMLDRPVAIKVLRPEYASRPQVVERFRSEAQTLARLSHPNIATLYAFLRDEDALLMVMEFVDGDTLSALVRRAGPLAVEAALPLAFQALDGIGYAHARGVVHRDIKGSNLMLDVAGRVKVMDFGIARMIGSQRMTRDGHFVGTPEYMSPEQVSGVEADARSDIYSLGVLLFEMLTGRVPFRQLGDFELMRAHVEAQPPSLRELAPAVPAPVEQAVLCALEKDPAARFPTVAAFRAALAEAAGLDAEVAAAEPSNLVALSRSAEAVRGAGAPDGRDAAGRGDAPVAPTRPIEPALVPSAFPRPAADPCDGASTTAASPSAVTWSAPDALRAARRAARDEDGLDAPTREWSLPPIAEAALDAAPGVDAPTAGAASRRTWSARIADCSRAALTALAVLLVAGINTVHVGPPPERVSAAPAPAARAPRDAAIAELDRLMPFEDRIASLRSSVDPMAPRHATDARRPPPALHASGAAADTKATQPPAAPPRARPRRRAPARAAAPSVASRPAQSAPGPRGAEIVIDRGAATPERGGGDAEWVILRE